MATTVWVCEYVTEDGSQHVGFHDSQAKAVAEITEAKGKGIVYSGGTRRP